MNTCPVCGKPVDPIRAPAVAVRDGKVISFCSKDCAALFGSGPIKLLPTKVVRVPTTDERVEREIGPSSARMRAVSPPSGIVADESITPPSAPAKSGSARQRSAAEGSAQVDAEIVNEPSKPIIVEATQQRRRQKRESVQIADTGHLDDYVNPERSKRGLVVALVLLVVAGGAAAAYFLGYFDKLLGREAQVAQVPRDAAVVVVADAAPPPITRESAVALAQEALRAQLAAVPRVQQQAAAALSRTGDANAIEVLAGALKGETGDIAKVELAYWLARAGDKRGFDSLMESASPLKREAKHEAGRRLALLADKRAIKVLESSLAYPQFRLGVAEQLAYLADPRALKILDDVLADAKALPDDKARAAIALGWAGRADIAPTLREMLGDTRNNAYAAPALANLHDEAARPVLVAQLEVTQLRVAAARALRRLAPDADVSALLPPLVAALSTSKDTVQIQIAETLLLLAGPPTWSERE